MKLTVVQSRTNSIKILGEIYEIQFLSSSCAQTNRHNKNGIIIQLYEGRNCTLD